MGKNKQIENLPKLGQDGALDLSLLEAQTTLVSWMTKCQCWHWHLDEWRIWRKKISSSVWPHLRTVGCRMTVQGLCVPVKTVTARMMNTTGKGGIVERLLAFSCVGTPTAQGE